MCLKVIFFLYFIYLCLFFFSNYVIWGFRYRQVGILTIVHP
uniref:Uncharacterized protein n=1 Tax=Myoviridae sp. cted82 TaxID=2827696 RepID=A0A8S5TNS6_9CAUD|nr:MAG TPA: hypothetical protein [Myoviridae sp. cted82]